jgi:hypothetical protein
MSAGSVSIEGQYDLIHATRQNLFQKIALIDFMAFVYLAEKRGEAHFRRSGPVSRVLKARVQPDVAIQELRHDLNKLFSLPWFPEACDKARLEISTCVSVIKICKIR